MDPKLVSTVLWFIVRNAQPSSQFWCKASKILCDQYNKVSFDIHKKPFSTTPKFILMMWILESTYGWGFPSGSVVKSLLANSVVEGLIPGLGRSPGEGSGNPLQCSCLKVPMNRKPVCTVLGLAQSQTQLSDRALMNGAWVSGEPTMWLKT